MDVFPATCASLISECHKGGSEQRLMPRNAGLINRHFFDAAVSINYLVLGDALFMESCVLGQGRATQSQARSDTTIRKGKARLGDTRQD